MSCAISDTREMIVSYTTLLERTPLVVGSGLESLTLALMCAKNTCTKDAPVPNYVHRQVNAGFFKSLLHSKIIQLVRFCADINSNTDIEACPISNNTISLIVSFLKETSVASSYDTFQKIATSFQSDSYRKVLSVYPDNDSIIFRKCFKEDPGLKVKDITKRVIHNFFNLLCKYLRLPSTVNWFSDKDTYITICKILSDFMTLITRVTTDTIEPYGDGIRLSSPLMFDSINLDTKENRQSKVYNITDSTLLVIPHPKYNMLHRIDEPETYGLSLIGERYVVSCNNT